MDTLLSSYPGLKGFRADVASFDVFKHGANLDTRFKAFSVDAFNLQAVEETLSAGVVVAVTLPDMNRQVDGACSFA